MKFFFIALFVIFSAPLSYSQTGEYPLPTGNKEPAYDIAPSFRGEPKAMMKYFEDSIRYPAAEKAKRIEGHVYLKFEVSKRGKIINVQPVNGVPGGPGLMKEAIRVIESMPLWNPATKNGKPVKTEFYLSVPFKLR